MCYTMCTQSQRGAYSQGNPDYAESEKLYPRYDPEKAKSLVKEYEAEHGKASISYSTTNTARQGQVAQLLQQQFEAIGIALEIKQMEQVQLITEALMGNYQLAGWRSFNAPDPDANYVWWSTYTSAPIGESAVNFARHEDPETQAALDKGRTSLDEADRLAAYQEINERFATNLPYIFTSRTVWGLYAAKKVENFNGRDLPDGAEGLSYFGGTFSPASTWLNA